MEKAKMMPAMLVTAGVLGALVLLGLIAIVVIYTGSYNIAATEEHTSFMRWALTTTLRTSVDSRADAVRTPERLTPEMISTGASAYKEMCQHCHSGPGVERAEWASGMRPRPPHLAEAAAKWELEEVFWLVKHGIKMSGMPAFGPTHQDQALWNIAAFVMKLPAMTPQEYAAFGSGSAGGHSHGERQH